MSSLSSLLVVSALSAMGGQAPAAQQQASGPASIAFVAKDQALVGIVYGIDAIDAQPRAFGQRLAADVPAGNRTVWYSCPDAPRLKDGSRITFDFVGGQHYELVCPPGKDAVIRTSDEC